MDKKEILNNYSKPEDKLLIAKMIDKNEMSCAKNKIEYTDFLDEYQQNLLIKIIHKEKMLYYILNGGIDDAQRKIILFYPSKLSDIAKDNYNKLLPIKCIRIVLPKELHNKYNHRDYLGALIKLGIKREKIGDILVFEDGADILILDEVKKFIKENISQLTRFSKSKIEEISLEEIRKKQINTKEIRAIVSSMRVDSIVSELAKTSRGKAEDIINEGRVFVNYENVMKTTKQIKENDIITIRRIGKFKLEKIDGKTRNDRVKIILNQYI